MMLGVTRSWSVPIATEGYEYPAGAISGQSGGSGFSSAWAGNGAVDQESLGYVDTTEAALQSAGNRVSTTVPGSGMFRTLTTAGLQPGLVDGTGGFGADGSTIYIAFLARLDSGVVTSFGDYGGISLFYRMTEQVFIGDPGFAGDRIRWAVDPQQGSGAVRESTVPVDSTVRLLVARIDFKPGFETVRLYVDPPLDGEPATPAAGPFEMHDTRFNRIRVQAGGNGRYSFDELRLGTTYADVVPANQPPTPRVVSQPATDVTATSAVMHGTVWADLAEETATFFELGHMPGEANWIAGAPPSASAGSRNVQFTASATGLRAHTRYSYRAVARSSRETAFGEFVAFTTGNSAPLAVDDLVHSRTGSVVMFDPRSNDTDPDGDVLTITQVSDGAHGTVTTDGTSIRYAGAATFNGNDTFTYQITDGIGAVATATVTLANFVPSAGSQEIHPAFGPGGSTEIDVSPLLTDGDGDLLRLTSVTGAASGVLSFSGTVITYTARQDFRGRDSFEYAVTDDAGGAATGTITFTNSPPQAANRVIHPDFGPGSGQTVDLQQLVSDADGDSLSIVALTRPAHGAVSFKRAARHLQRR
jgi:hypothetical protein